MKSRPILFSAPMVRALLAGTKTQTRRVVKPQPIFSAAAGDSWEWHGGSALMKAGYGAPYVHTNRGHVVKAMTTICPYGKPGDLLWVRERAAFYWNDWHYFADGPTAWGKDVSDKTFSRPSIHMPRAASRLTLRITDVRVERLQEISEEDARAEGILHVGKTVNETDMWAQFGAIEKTSAGLCADVRYVGRTAVKAYERLWESINGCDSWAANPWCWCLTFDVIKQNVDTVLKAAA